MRLFLIENLVVVLAVFLIVTGIWLIFRTMPGFFTRNRMEAAETLWLFSGWEHKIKRFRSLSYSDKTITVIGALFYFKAFQYAVISEQRKMIKKRVLVLTRQIEMIQLSGNSNYIIGPLTATRDTLLRLLDTPNRVFEYEEGDSTLKKVECRLNESLNLLMSIQSSCQSVDNLLAELAAHPNPEVRELKSQISDQFVRTVAEMSKMDITTSQQLSQVRSALNHLHNLASELKTESDLLDAETECVEESTDFYTLLEVPHSASAAEIEAAYKKKLRRYHPDTKQAELNKMDDPEVREEVERIFNVRMRILTEARDTLVDPVKRAEYNRKQGL